MKSSLPASELDRYFEIISGERDEADDVSFVKSLLERHPELARYRMPDGSLPLRSCLVPRRAGYFEMLVNHGAEHDIFTACAANDFAVVERLLDQNEQSVKATDDSGCTPLHWACTSRWRGVPDEETKIVSLLIERGAILEARNHRDETPLQTGLLQGMGEAAFLLWEHGAEPDLMLGICAEDFELMDELLEANPDAIHWRADDGQSLLHFAVREEASVDVIEYLLARGASAELETRHCGSTPLHESLRTHPDVVEILVRYGADVNAKKWDRGLYAAKSALNIAICEDRIAAVDVLIANGANVNESLTRRRSLLTEVKSREVAELLIKAGVAVNSKDDFGRTPIDSAIEEGRCDVADLLIRHGGRTSVFSLAAIGDHQQVGAMLEANPDLVFAFNEFPGATDDWLPPDAKTCEVPWGSVYGTALNYAVKSGSLSMVRLLLQRGADVNASTQPAGWAPLHDAVYYAICNDLRDGPAIIRELVARGANLDARTWGGYRPIDIADYLYFREPAAKIFDLVADLDRNAIKGSPSPE